MSTRIPLGTVAVEHLAPYQIAVAVALLDIAFSFRSGKNDHDRTNKRNREEDKQPSDMRSLPRWPPWAHRLQRHGLDGLDVSGQRTPGPFETDAITPTYDYPVLSENYIGT